jgi:hypothetical protein
LGIAQGGIFVKRLYSVGLFALMLTLSSAITIHALESVTLTPDQITVAGRRGTTETRTVLLQTTDPITDVKIIPLDLTRADGEHVLPAAAIAGVLSDNAITTNSVLTIPLTIDLNNVSSGKFTGNLLIRYHGGAKHLPITVTVKDPWLSPLMVLLLGVGLSVGISYYREKGRPRDAILVRMGQFRAQMHGAPDLAQTFKQRIEAYLVDVEVALQAENWEEAETAIKRAEAVWTRWRKAPDDWLAQLDYHAQLVGKLQDEPNVPYIQALRRELEKVQREASEMEGAHKLRERLDDIAQQINDYVRLQKSLDQLNDLRIQLPADQAKSWGHKAQVFQQRLHALDPDDTQAYQTLQEDIQKGMDALAQETAKEQGVVKAARGLEAGGLEIGTNLLDLLAPPPATREITDGATTRAGRRLRWFTWVTYAVAVVLLAGAGFGELYISNATFGANAWGDYFALLAWGFGAEASRAAIADIVQSWGVVSGSE